jgi:hypothetical protein
MRIGSKLAAALSAALGVAVALSSACANCADLGEVLHERSLCAESSSEVVMTKY